MHTVKNPIIATSTSNRRYKISFSQVKNLTEGIKISISQVGAQTRTPQQRNTVPITRIGQYTLIPERKFYITHKDNP